MDITTNTNESETNFGVEIAKTAAISAAASAASLAGMALALFAWSKFHDFKEKRREAKKTPATTESE